MIELRAVTKRFPDGTVAVDDLSFELATGEVLALLGSSGSGKTTTLRMINRLIEPTAGTIAINGRDVRSMKVHELRRGIGYVIQQAGLFPHRRVVDNVATVPRLLGWDRQRARDRAMELLDLVGLEPGLATRYPAQLSGGQQQRVGVARALAADPPVLLMDEPFGAVDPIVRAQLQQEFARVQRELQKTVVFVTHDVDEAVQLSDRVAVLRPGGTLAQYGSPAEVLAHPADAFVRDFVGSDRRVKLLGLLPAKDVPRRAIDTVCSACTLIVDDQGRPRGWRREVPRSLHPLVPIGPDATARNVLDEALSSVAGAAVHVDALGRATGISTLADLGGLGDPRSAPS